jgi:hypothetical protein
MINLTKEKLIVQLQSNWLPICNLPSKYPSNKNILAAVLALNGLALQYLFTPLLMDIEVVRFAVN